MGVNQQMFITKASGEVVVFDKRKLRNSLERSGAGEALINDIIAEVEHDLYTGIPTKDIYKKAFSLLKRKSKPSAARYRLKRAIIELGPTGYPFEHFIGQLLLHQGYDIEVGIVVQGHCVTHEVDVVAARGNKHFMVECKFHSDFNRKCHVQVPLYIQSRFLDIKRQWKKQHDHSDKFHQGWIVTNTRFTSDAIQYGTCMGLMLIGWDYPQGGSLKERIDTSGLHPITCLSTLTKDEKQLLLDQGIVLCKQLLTQQELLVAEGKKKDRVIEELNGLLNL